MEREKKFEALLVRYFEKDASEEDLLQLKAYLNESKENCKRFDELNEIYQLTDITAKGWLYDIDSNWNQLKARIQSNSIAPVVKMVSNKIHMLWKTAAVIALLLATTFMGLFISDRLAVDSRMVKFVAPKGEKSKVILDDGTLVWLNSGSELSYHLDKRSKTRKVDLTGEGYFEVSKNKELPFVVHTKRFDIKVLGTQFNVSAYDSDIVNEATLKEGSISVLNNRTGKYLDIEPGEQVKVNLKTNKMTVENVRVDDYMAWIENKLRFDNSSFLEVVKKLERWYDVNIILDDELLYKERYTMTVKTESLREVLELIQITTPIHYKIEEEKVFITYGNLD
ncbi:FecR family protein [Plebeiibacterium marinum]|uniref:DUF4974 domain-containing protein n=1 Tax=Plebeiibacterium marinum TaxID=2992111 RepID=A0AAE3MH11_9BACT|nr:FecR domain-containing protein [Plebeiobacterium marinum]MCW3807507.1 DUF4974 domain-containing protein [Plebeiobacterium marinum]